MIADLERMSNKDEFFVDTFDTLKEVSEQQGKRECLKGAIIKGKVLGGKNSGHMKELIKPVTKLSRKHIMNLSIGN